MLSTTLCRSTARAGSEGEAFAHAVEEVLHRRLGHPVHECLVERPSDHSQRWTVASADRQLRARGSERGDLDVGIELWDGTDAVLRLPGDRERRRLGSDRDGYADIDLYLPVDPAVVTDLESDVDEQPLALASRFGRHAGQPRSGVGQQRPLHLVERELQLEEIPDEHGIEDAAGRDAPRRAEGPPMYGT